MKHALLFASCVAAIAVIGGCKKNSSDPAGSKPVEPTKPATPPPPPPAFTGALTVERVLSADGVISRTNGNVAWADGLAQIEAKLGKATKVDGNKYQWAVVEGDDCAYFEMQKEAGEKYGATGDIVGMTMKPMKVAKDGPSMNRADCLKITGVTAGPPEDPNAAGPPTDGSAVTVASFNASVIPGRSKWKDQIVKVTGYVMGITNSSSGKDTWVTVQLTTSSTETKPDVACHLPTNAAAAVKLGDTAIATGKVEIKEMVSMGAGETSLNAGLADCTAEVAKKGK